MHSEHKPIQILDETLINKIAAGEVVERPSSVVKELVENAIDAQSKTITVKIAEGGKKLIQVLDDGVGLPKDQLKLAVSRHATSKIENFDDLYRLQTKGFRGEALASIASVSQLEFASCVEGEEAHEILIHGGEYVDERACALPRGTRVTVKYLFYQTPARLKFLRTKETETSHIVDVITKMALSHPHIHFKLYQNDRTLLDVPVSKDPLQRVLSLVGTDLKDYLYPFSDEQPGLSMQGYFGHPNVARSQRKGVFFFVNGRAVNDKVLWHSSMEAYRDLLMKGKYPVLVMHLQIDESKLDVNVHPQKSEIRFHHPTEVHAFVRRGLRAHLQASPWLQQALGHLERGEAESRDLSARPDGLGRDDKGGLDRHVAFQAPRDDGVRYDVRDPSLALRMTEQTKEIQFGKTEYAQMVPIGQLWATYILCESQGKLILVDQHAAHERVGFEKLMLQYEKSGIQSVPLLVPESFDLKPSDVDILKNYLDDLLKFGFEVDFFGGNTFVLKAEPTLFKGKLKFTNLIQDILDDVKETGEIVALKDKMHHIFATMACHAQIRANHHLTREEMQALLKELDEYQFTDFCPHGRPVSIEVTKDEVEKWFRRVL